MKTTASPSDPEQAFSDSLRNFPLGTSALIASSREVQSEYKNSSAFLHAHSLYWQIYNQKEAMKTVAHHPV